METINTANKFLKSATFKMIVISVLILVLLIPRFMISDLIRERKSTMSSTIKEVQDKWSHGQTVKGPVIKIPYIERYISENTKEITIKRIATILPESLNINAEITPQMLKRSLYNVVVYNSDINIQGKFKLPDFTSWNIKTEDILWNEASILVYLSDLRGIQENTTFNINKNKYSFESGIKEPNGQKGINFNIDITSENFDGNFKCKRFKQSIILPYRQNKQCKRIFHLERSWVYRRLFT